MKRFVIILVVLLCVLVAADFLLKAAAENAASKLIDKQIPQRVEPEVRLGSFPFLLSLLRGSFDEVVIEIPEALDGKLVVEDIRLTLKDVELEALEVLAGRGNLFAKTLEGQGVISEASVNEAVADQAPGVEVELREQRVTVSKDGVSLPATAVVAGNRILIAAGEVVGPLEIPLPELLRDVQFSSLRAERGRLVLGVVATRLRIRT